MPKVSVIIPVYSVEPYIAKCARSLFTQTLDDIEYLFINDCTPDKSIAVIQKILAEEFPHRKSHVKIINMMQNSGQAKVRETGIRHATGDFIINCDSDDWVEKDADEKMYSCAIRNSAEMVFCDYYDTNGTVSFKKIQRASWDNKELLLGEFIRGSVKGSLCTVMVKKALFNNPIFTFPKGDMIEDVTMIVQLLYFSNVIVHLNEHLYYYYSNSCSITHTITKYMCRKRYQDSVENTLLIESFLHKTGIRCKYKKDITLRKIDAMSQLNPCLQDMDYLKLWRHTFNGLTEDIVSHTEKKIIIKYLLTYIGLYPIWHKLRGYKFAN